MLKKIATQFVLLICACVLGAAARGAEQPLSVDDVRLLLIGGAAPAKLVALIEQHGISFHLTPELEKKFRDDSADDSVILELRKAETPATHAGPGMGPSGQPPPATNQGSPVDKQQAKEQTKEQPAPSASSVDRQVAEAIAALGDHPATTEGSAPGDRQDEEDHPLAPSFTLKDLSGHRLSLDDYKGKVVILDFWATWCAPCRSEIPAFVKLQNQYRERGLQIIGISVDNTSGPVKKFYEDFMMNYRVAMCDQTTRRIYGGLAGVPTTLLIGRDGRIYTKVVGAPANLETFEHRIVGLLGPAAGGAVMASNPADAKPTPAASSSIAPSAVDAKSSTRATNPSANAPSAGSAATPSLATEVAQAKAVMPDAKPPRTDLTDPPPDQVQKIIQEFAAKEKTFKQARNNYAYHQINIVETLGPDGDVDGEYKQEWDILYEDSGKRIEKVTYAPLDTLKSLLITKEDLDAFRNINPFVLTSDELPDYEVKYLGHVKVDEITAYVFSIRPKEFQKGRQYFQGIIWVDDRDLQIVKSEGKSVPEQKTKKGENLFPRFTTYREQIDGKFWFPTFTKAEDTLYFSAGSVHMREVIRYSDYKQFKSKTRIISATATDEPNAKPIAQPPAPKEKQKP